VDDVGWTETSFFLIVATQLSVLSERGAKYGYNSSKDTILWDTRNAHRWKKLKGTGFEFSILGLPPPSFEVKEVLAKSSSSVGILGSFFCVSVLAATSAVIELLYISGEDKYWSLNPSR
jgi:hypothetical protein